MKSQYKIEKKAPIKTPPPKKAKQKYKKRKYTKKISNSNYAIEKNVEVPIKKPLTQHEKYPFKKMKKGDSFFVPWKDHPGNEKSLSMTLVALTRKYKCKNKKFMVKIDNKNKGVRCWRTD